MKKRYSIKSIAILLILSICMSIFPSSVFAVANNINNTEKIETELYLSDVVGENIDGILAETDVPEIIGYQESVASNHIARLYEDEGTDLNKVVFLNADSTKTMYLFGFPVKYIDNNGNIQDISLDISDNAEKSGEFKTAANNVITSFAAKFTDGITLKESETEIRLVPVVPAVNSNEQTELTSGSIATIVANATAQRVDENTIKYQYDSKTVIEYSLTYTGFKEDIVVQEYTGQTTYSFRLYTNGLKLDKLDGSYYLVNENGDIKATIGDIIVFTADNRNNTFGEIIPTTIVENEEYLLNIVVDADYLADPNTTYPIRIDPTIEVNYDEDGASAIEDITISTNTNFSGSHTSLYVGRRSTEGIARALIRFPGLDLSGLTPSAITNASLRVRDLMCEGEQMNIYCHAFTGNVWDANSATWDSVNPDSYSASPISTVTMSWSIGDALDPIHWYTFNITEAVSGWTDYTYSQNKGLMLKMDDATESGSTIKNRTFGSYNRASYKPSLTVTYTDGTGGGDSFTDASTLSLGVSKYITTTIKQEQRYFKFTPTETADYVIMSSNYTGDPKVWLYNSNGTYIDDADDISYPSNKNFWFKYRLYANTTYYIGAGHAANQIGGYYFVILKPAELANGFYHVKNSYSSKYLDVCGPGEQIYVHQWTKHTGEQEKWLIQGHVENGKIAYYTIRSQFGNNKYIGISSTNTGENNIQLFDTINSDTKWNIYSTTSGSYFLEPINAKGRGMYAADTGTATKMQLSTAAPGSTKTKWVLESYNYSDVNRTFSAFDVGNSAEDEVAIVKQWMESFGYTDIGSYNNAESIISAQEIKEIGRYSDFVYINGHGEKYANMRIQNAAGEIVEYLCADLSCTSLHSSDVPRVVIGAKWLSGSTTKTNSYWNMRTKWGILAQCDQLDFGSVGAGEHWNGLSSAEMWARTMLGDGEQVHGYLGYYNSAPGGSTHTERLKAFFGYQGMSLVEAWAFTHTRYIGSSDWAAVYRSEHIDDSFTDMSGSTNGSDHNIYYVSRSVSDTGLNLQAKTSSVEQISLQVSNNAYPMLVTSSDTTRSINEIYTRLQTTLKNSRSGILNIGENGAITYYAEDRNWGEQKSPYTLSNLEAVSVAEKILSEQGLLPDDNYRASVSTIQRTKLDLSGNQKHETETIEYVVTFYHTYNGIDVLSDQEDGIMVSFDANGLTELRYLWRNIEYAPISQHAATEILTTSQAARIFQTEALSGSSIVVGSKGVNMDDTCVSTAYLQINGAVRPVYVFASDTNYTNSVFIDMYTGEVLYPESH